MIVKGGGVVKVGIKEVEAILVGVSVGADVVRSLITVHDDPKSVEN